MLGKKAEKKVKSFFKKVCKSFEKKSGTKKLYLVRHAKSDKNGPEMNDIDRPLNNRGKDDAPEMGSRLKKGGHSMDLILSSPAKRAMKTAKLIAKKIDYPKDKIIMDEGIYENTAGSLLKIVNNIDDRKNSVMITGHFPGLLEFAELLTDKNLEHMPTCSVICIEFKDVSWKKIDRKTGKLVFFDYPKNK